MLTELYALGRIALGAAAIVAPAPVAASFGLGDAPGTVVAARMIGGRDLFLGLGVAIAARRGASTRGWIEACIAVDAVDGFATAEAVRTGALDKNRGLIVGALVLGAIAAGAFLVGCPLAKRIPREAC